MVARGSEEAGLGASAPLRRIDRRNLSAVELRISTKSTMSAIYVVLRGAAVEKAHAPFCVLQALLRRVLRGGAKGDRRPQRRRLSKLYGVGDRLALRRDETARQTREWLWCRPPRVIDVVSTTGTATSSFRFTTCTIRLIAWAASSTSIELDCKTLCSSGVRSELVSS